ncbi:MAG: hypothetical protein HY648_06395 [Acidobacteria bacterium]|nr:hypothetical protein [Acidobacteriota bacterium]
MRLKKSSGNPHSGTKQRLPQRNTSSQQKRRKAVAATSGIAQAEMRARDASPASLLAEKPIPAETPLPLQAPPKLLDPREKTITVKEAAFRLRKSDDAVYVWLRAGRLRGWQPGGRGCAIAVSEVSVAEALLQPAGTN